MLRQCTVGSFVTLLQLKLSCHFVEYFCFVLLMKHLSLVSATPLLANYIERVALWLHTLWEGRHLNKKSDLSYNPNKTEP